MTYKQMWEQLEYSLIARLDLLSDKEKDPVDDYGRQNRIDALERTLKRMAELEKHVSNNGLKIV